MPGEELHLAAGAATPTATRYYTWAGSPVAVRTPTKLSWLATDNQNTAQIAIDPTTQAATERRQTPYGTPRGTPPTDWPDTHGYLNGPQDPTGLTHLGAREYDPTTGRFLSADPLLTPTDPQQLNGYTYANNNPTTASDPTGQRPCMDSKCGGTPDSDYDREQAQNARADNARDGAINTAQKKAKQAFGNAFKPTAKVCKGQEYQCNEAVARVNNGDWTIVHALAYLTCGDHALNGQCPRQGKADWYGFLVFITTVAPASVCAAGWAACAAALGLGAGEVGLVNEEAATFEAEGLAESEGGDLASSAEARAQAAKDYGDFGKAYADALVERGGQVPGSAEAVKLAYQLSLKSASSPFEADGTLTSDAIQNSYKIIPGEEIRNPELQARFASNGGASEWGKYSTQTNQSPFGDFQVHYYRNSVTGEIMYDYDYKVVMNRRGSKS